MEFVNGIEDWEITDNIQKMQTMNVMTTKWQSYRTWAVSLVHNLITPNMIKYIHMLLKYPFCVSCWFLWPKKATSCPQLRISQGFWCQGTNGLSFTEKNPNRFFGVIGIHLHIFSSAVLTKRPTIKRPTKRPDRETCPQVDMKLCPKMPPVVLWRLRWT